MDRVCALVLYIFVIVHVTGLPQQEECPPGKIQVKACVVSRSTRDFPIADDLKNTPCSPNDYFKIDCNMCYCNLDNSGYLCTENLCPLQTEKGASTTIENTISANGVTTAKTIITTDNRTTSTFNGTEEDGRTTSSTTPETSSSS